MYAWLGTNNHPAMPYAWYIPVLFPLFGGVRSYALLRQINIVAGYLRELEQDFPRSDPAKPRYEHFLVEFWKNERLSRAPRIGWTAVAFWVVFELITLFVPCIAHVRCIFRAGA